MVLLIFFTYRTSNIISNVGECKNVSTDMTILNSLVDNIGLVSECDSTAWGTLCDKTCGRCKSPPCDVINGSCSDGCADGWAPPTCTGNLYSFTYKASKDSTSHLGLL